MDPGRYGNKKIAILGAGPLQTDLIRRANELGLYTLVFASGSDNPGKAYCDEFFPVSITERDAILAKCKEKNIAGICSVSSDLAVETWFFVADKLNLVCTPYASVEFLRNKMQMYQKLTGELKVPKSAILTDPEAYAGPFPCIIKPVDGWGSKGVAFCENKKSLSAHFSIAQRHSIRGIVMVSEYLNGPEFSVESISFKGEHHILAITSKETTGAPHFVETGHHLPALLNEQLAQIIRKQSARALQLLGHENGAGHTEIKVQEEGIYFLEVAGRMAGDFIGSRLIPTHTGYDYIKAVIDISLGYFETPQISPEGYTGIIYNNPDKPILLPYMSGKKSLPIDVIDYNFDAGSAAGMLQESRDRTSYLIYHSAKPFKL